LLLRRYSADDRLLVRELRLGKETTFDLNKGLPQHLSTEDRP
jgi:hypothetical protein